MIFSTIAIVTCFPIVLKFHYRPALLNSKGLILKDGFQIFMSPPLHVLPKKTN